MSLSDSINIGGREIFNGERVQVDLPLGTLPSLHDLDMHVFVVRGSEPGPTLFLSAAIHGDEINGVEIVRRVLETVQADRLAGTLIGIPIVNIFGFIRESRYLPDRRDLNRSFPGSKRGSLASRIANLFMNEIVQKCDYGIDLHTAAQGRFNLPQVRGDFSDPEAHRVAAAFGAPVYLHAKAPEGTVRRAANKIGKPVILFEGGEAGRFEPHAINVGVDGIQRVMKELGMIRSAPRADESLEAKGTKWVRAKRGGLLRLDRMTGEPIKRRQKIGTIGDAMNETSVRVLAPCDGIIISHATNPLIHQGDAVVHIAKTGDDD